MPLAEAWISPESWSNAACAAASSGKARIAVIKALLAALSSPSPVAIWFGVWPAEPKLLLLMTST